MRQTRSFEKLTEHKPQQTGTDSTAFWGRKQEYWREERIISVFLWAMRKPIHALCIMLPQLSKFGSKLDGSLCSIIEVDKNLRCNNPNITFDKLQEDSCLLYASAPTLLSPTSGRLPPPSPAKLYLKEDLTHLSSHSIYNASPTTYTHGSLLLLPLAAKLSFIASLSLSQNRSIFFPCNHPPISNGSIQVSHHVLPCAAVKPGPILSVTPSTGSR